VGRIWEEHRWAHKTLHIFLSFCWNSLGFFVRLGAVASQLVFRVLANWYSGLFVVVNLVSVEE